MDQRGNQIDKKIEIKNKFIFESSGENPVSPDYTRNTYSVVYPYVQPIPQNMDLASTTSTLELNANEVSVACDVNNKETIDTVTEPQPQDDTDNSSPASNTFTWSNLEKVIVLCADYLTPRDVYAQFPLVSKRFHHLVRTFFPRIVLTTYHHVPRQCIQFNPNSTDNYAVFDGNQYQSVTPKVQLSQVKILDEWTKLPPSIASYIGVNRAALTLSSLIDIDILPQNDADIEKVMAGTRGAVHIMMLKRLPKSTEEKYSIQSDVLIVPWETNVHSGVLHSELVVYRLQKLLQIFEIKRLELQEPNALSIRLIKNDLYHLKMSGLKHPFDFRRLASLTQLKSLVLIGQGPLVDVPEENLFEAKELLPLVHLAPTLNHLFICRFFPLANYGEFINIIGQLVNLRTLMVYGLYQGDQPAEQLALLISRLEKLEYLNQLGHIDRDFWYDLYRFTNKNGHPRLKIFTLELDIYTSVNCFERHLMAFTKIFPALEYITIKFTEPEDLDFDDEASSLDENDSSMTVDEDGGNQKRSTPSFMPIASVDHRFDSSPTKASCDCTVKLDASKAISSIHLWCQAHSHPNMKQITLVGLKVSMDTIEKLALFNFTHIFPKISIKTDVYDC